MAQKNNKPMKKESIDKVSSKPRFTLSLNKLLIILLVVLVGRMLFSTLPSYKIDMGVYRSWASYLADPDNSFKDFYRNTHCVYGPFYMYFLTITGKIFNAFPQMQQAGQEFFVKIWAVLSDVIGGILIYLIGRKYKKEGLGLLLGLIYIFNPAILFNSSVWGQFDSYTATLLLAVIFLFNCKKTVPAVFMYAVACLNKPQSIAIIPFVVVLYFKDFPWKSFIESRKNKDKVLFKSSLFKTLTKLAITVAGCMIIYAVLVLPFYKETSFYFLKEFEVYGTTDQATNLMPNKNFKASAEEDTMFNANKVADGDENTAWSSGHTSNQWIYADLGAEQDINRINLKWGWEYAKEYKLQISNDAQNWVDVYSPNSGKGEVTYPQSSYQGKFESIQIDSVKARYIKLECIKRQFPYGLFNIDENTSFFTKSAFKTVDLYFWLVHQYSTSLNDYPYATANGFNFWTVMKKQTVSDKEPFAFGLSSLIWGYVLWGIVSILTMILLIKKKKSVLALYYSGYFLTLGIFVFATKMHERYMLPALIFATICIFWEKRMVVPYIVLSICCLINQWHAYNAGNADRPWIEPNDSLAMFAAVVTLVIMLASVAYTVWFTNRDNGNQQTNKIQTAKGQ